ncbi:hypothetical protein RQP46_010412 [Phenoliferia psychrophenolica]
MMTEANGEPSWGSFDHTRIVPQIAPLPPHWVVNVVAPHPGISIWHFWISTFLGIAGVSLIHRIAPLPPHWVVNVVAPHLGISIWHFWIATFLGIAGVSLIHTQIGTTLDQMTGTSDFHIISIQNGAGLGGIMLAVLVPVFLRRRYKKDLELAATDDDAVPVASSPRSPNSLSSPLLAPTLVLSGPYSDDDDASIVGHATRQSERSFDIGSDDESEEEGRVRSKVKGKGRE